MKAYHNFSRLFLGGLLVLLLFPCTVHSQSVSINPRLLEGGWRAHWISCPGIEARSYGVFHFRKTFQLAGVPAHFIVHVSADNRYHLFVNGTPIGRGPARSSLYNWNFGSYDLAPYLKTGKNVIAAQVWNMGVYAPVAQISQQTGFLLQGDGPAAEKINSDGSWKVLRDSAYAPTATDGGAILHSYVAVGACDAVHGDRYPWGWETTDFDATDWANAAVVHTPVVPTGYGTDNRWTLSPRRIPQMEERVQRIPAVRRSSRPVDTAFLSGTRPLVIPAHTSVTLLLDQSFETIGYPVVQVSGGAGSRIKLTYAEALFDSNGQKGNRDVVEGKNIRGLYDIFYPDGGTDRKFTTLWVRTWRYMQLDIQTGDAALQLNDLHGLFSAYPFQQRATFSANDPSLAVIWKTGWHTARLCAGETYFDCPYYEQLQYEGDTRIQGLISLYNTGDDRLVRKAINDFYLSRVPSGLTQGRFPSNRLQVIPPFSLFWVSMLYDYRMLCPDGDFVEQYLDAAALLLKWFERRVDPNYDMLGPMKWWNFTDWNDAFRNGVPDGATDGHSSVITLQYAYTLKQAAQLFDSYGREAEATHYRQLGQRLAAGTFQHCFNQARMEMANQPEQKAYSQHAGIMAILAGAIPKGQQTRVMAHILNDTTLSQATFYYRFYLTRALIATGQGDLYYGHLDPWRNMLKAGLTTFAEKPDPTRSDCHAWSASPNYDFLATLCGIMPDAPGFKKVKIQPALGALKEVMASMPLPGRQDSAQIQVHFMRTAGGGLTGQVTLPRDLSGNLIWKGQTLPLHGGRQAIEVR